MADKEFGKELPNGSWTGIIGELRAGVREFCLYCTDGIGERERERERDDSVNLEEHF